MKDRAVPSYEMMLDYVKCRFEENGGQQQTKSGRSFSFRSRYEHTKRVVLWAKRLLKMESADEELVLTAAIFHDVGYSMAGSVNHAENSAILCGEYMRSNGFGETFVREVVSLVARHADKTVSRNALSPELKVLMDADILDEVGALTILWDAMDEGKGEFPSYIGTCARIEKALGFLEKHQTELKTTAGEAWYGEKTAFLRTFVSQVRFDLGADED